MRQRLVSDFEGAQRELQRVSGDLDRERNAHRALRNWNAGSRQSKVRYTLFGSVGAES